MEASIMIILAALCIMIYLFLKRLSNTDRPTKEREFNQAGVRVSFCNGTIAINDYTYDVHQVTGIRINPYQSAREYYERKGENVIIEVDDFRKPRYKINFVKSEQAEQFMQRLILALKKAGRPKLI